MSWAVPTTLWPSAPSEGGFSGGAGGVPGGGAPNAPDGSSARPVTASSNATNPKRPRLLITDPVPDTSPAADSGSQRLA
jgi:hypothetical protein